MTEVEAFARAWASMDGNLDKFIACKEDVSLEDREGHYGGYMHEAEELISRARKYLATSEAAGRYKVVEGSQSKHCCFDFTVVDTTRPEMIGGKQYLDEFEEVCETFHREEADLIAAALNRAGSDS